MSTDKSFEETFAVNSEEMELRDSLKEFRSATSEIGAGHIAKVVQKFGEKFGQEFVDKLNEKDEDGTSFIDDIIMYSSFTTDVMMSIWGNMVVPGRGIYESLENITDYGLRMTFLKSNESGWPVLPGFLPGRTCIKINFAPAGTPINGNPEDLSEEDVGSFTPYVVRGDGEVHPMIYVSEEYRELIFSTLRAGGIESNDDYKEHKGKWILFDRIEKNHIQHVVSNTEYLLDQISELTNKPFCKDGLSPIEQLDSEISDFIVLDGRDIQENSEYLDGLMKDGYSGVGFELMDGKAVGFILTGEHPEINVTKQLSGEGADIIDSLIEYLAPNISEEEGKGWCYILYKNLEASDFDKDFDEMVFEDESE